MPEIVKRRHSSSNGESTKQQLTFEEKEFQSLKEYGIIDEKYYGKPIPDDKAYAYGSDDSIKPLTILNKKIQDTSKRRSEVKPGKSVLHWFRCDIRILDNKALSRANEFAKQNNVPLICLFLVSQEDWDAHAVSKRKIDFIRRNLEVLKIELKERGIPLLIELVEHRKDTPSKIVEVAQKWDCNHIFANFQYEVDELRRDTKTVQSCVDSGIDLNLIHDTCIVPPGELTTKSTGKPYAVFSPWYKAWSHYVIAHPDVIRGASKVEGNSDQVLKSLEGPESPFEMGVFPTLQDKFTLSPEDVKKMTEYWPEGEEAALTKLKKFISSIIKNYAEDRSVPALSATSGLSAYFSSGVLSSRTAVRMAIEYNNIKLKTLPERTSSSVVNWIIEVAWRDFYRHVLASWPYVCMNKPFKLDSTHIEWHYDADAIRRWKEGKTGFPIVDAAMRQLSETGYMHNRCRMIVASFLTKDLLVNWQIGEQWFMTNLVDGDFASNNGGWGWSASTGVDPQPYFRIFNPTLQSERFDPEGKYIKQWVPELKDVQGKAIHDPYKKGYAQIAKQNGYPEPIVDHKEMREKALDMYKGL